MASANLLLVLVVAASTVETSLQACPPDTVVVPGGGAPGQSWCIRAHATPANFCDAVKTCHSSGAEMISRPVFDAMKVGFASAFAGPDQWWVGLADAMHERNMSKAGWVWMLDGQLTDEADGYFLSTEPNDRFAQDCVTSVKAKQQLRDESCAALWPFYCYYTWDPLRAVAVSASVEFRYAMTPIVEYGQPDAGCWIGQPDIASLLSCGLACFTLGFADCVGFYWNSAMLECILLPYFDAAVPLSFSNDSEKLQWAKYLLTA